MIYAVCIILVLYLLFVHFLAVMCLQSARDRGTITPTGVRFGYVVLAIGYVFDFLGQIIACFIFAELPRELTVSKRIKRLIGTGSGWRKERAEWWRDHLLKSFDPTGRHG